MKDVAYYNHITELVNAALNDTNIVSDQHLTKLLTKIGAAALKHQCYYDDKRAFQPAVSFYAVTHHQKIPDELLALLKYVDTPNSWSGF